MEYLWQEKDIQAVSLTSVNRRGLDSDAFKIFLVGGLESANLYVSWNFFIKYKLSLMALIAS